VERNADGEDASDPSVEVSSVACFGPCGLAPAFRLDGRVLRTPGDDDVTLLLGRLLGSPRREEDES